MIDMPGVSLIGFMSNKVKSGGGVNLAQGIPGFKPPKELIDCFVECAKSDIHQYAPGDGDLKLAEVVRGMYVDRLASDFDFMITQGATEAVSLIYLYLTQLEGRFGGLAFEPVYESYSNLSAIYGNDFQAFNIDGGVDFERLERAIDEGGIKLIFANSPNNPSGRVLSEFEFEGLIDLVERKGIYMIVDSVYEELYYDRKPYIPFAKMGSNVFYVNSFSKLFSITGWRVGYFAAHKSHFKRLKYIHDYTGLCASSVAQRAIADYMTGFDYERYVDELRLNLVRNYEFVADRLTKLGFRIERGDGGYFVWGQLPEGMDDGFEFAIELYDQQRVAVVPGIHFSAHAANYVRINIAREEEELRLGIEGIEKFVNDRMGR